MRQVRQHAHADDTVNVCPMKLNVWSLEAVEREDEGRDICPGRRGWMGE